MAEEAAVVEEIKPVVAEPEPEPSPSGDAPAPQGEPEGERQSLLKELFKGATADELRAALAEVPSEIRGEVEAEIERRGEQRAQTRQREIQTAKTDRMAVWKPLADQYPQAEAQLVAAVSRAKAGDIEALSNVDQLTAAINAYRNGAVAKLVIDNESYVHDLLESILPDATPDEMKELEKPLYEFGRTGMARHAVPVIAELAIKRREQAAFEKGKAEGLKAKEAQATLAERLTNLAKVQKESPGVAIQSSAVTRESEIVQLQREIRDFDPSKMPRAEAQARYEELQNKLRQLQQE